jgi:hypothetical protein
MRRPGWLSKLLRTQHSCPDCGASVKETHCDVCGYDLVRKTRGEAGLRRPPA